MPTTTFLRDPVVAGIGLTWQAANGFFIGGGGAWNFNMKGRDEAAGFGVPAGAEQRLRRPGRLPGARRLFAGHEEPGVRRGSAAPTATATSAAATTAPAATRAAGQSAARGAGELCDPCRVELGKVATASADARDPDGDALTYRWTASNGTIANATGRQAQWTASNQPGPATLTVTVTDGKGGIPRPRRPRFLCGRAAAQGIQLRRRALRIR